MKQLVYLSILLVFIFASPCAAQKNSNPERAKQLKTYPENKDAKVIAYKNSSAYTFQTSGDDVTVLAEETTDMISLEGNLDYVEHQYYHDHLKLEEFDLHFTSGKSLPKTHVCGNYEVENIFYSDSKVCSYPFNFLYAGTEISFRSRARYDDPRYFTKIFFHDEKPSEFREITITVPDQVVIELVEKNFDGFNIKKTVTQDGHNTIYSYKVNRLPALKSENNSLGALYHYPHLVVLTKELKSSSGKKIILSSLDDLYKWYALLVKDVKNDPKPMKEEVQRLTATSKTPEDKMRAVYYWVQDNIKYIAFEDGIAGFRPETAQNVYANRYGDCKGMANLTKEMLKIAGFDARLTWIGTNRIPYTYDLPSLCVDNHMICTVTLNGQLYILDSTEKYIALGKNAERIQGKEMLIENGDGFIRTKVPVADFTGNLVARSETLTLEGETLKGQGELALNGEAKKNVLYYSTNDKQENKKKLYDNLAISEYSNMDKVEVINTPPEDREKPLEVKYSYALSNKISRFGNDVYVDLDFNKPYQGMTIEDDRVSDYYFNRKVKLKTTKKFILPNGYKITSMPKGMSKKYSDFSFEVSYRQTGNEVFYSNEITVNNGIVKRSDFPVWNECIKALKETYGDQLVLTKSK